MSGKPSIHLIFAIALALALSIFTLYQVNKIPDPAYPDFKPVYTLQSAGGPYGLKEMSGKVGLMFFGYTHCPDVCPATLVNFGKALEMLEQPEREKVRAIFVSLDPERDTVEIIDKYAKYFHPQIIGLGGSQQEIDTVAKTFYVGVQMDEPNEKGNYSMKHATTLFVIRPDGEMGELLSHNSSPEEIVAVLRRWLPWAE